MGTNLLKCLSLATVVVACSSPAAQAGREPVTRTDASTRDAAAACAVHAGEPADFALQLLGTAQYGGNIGYEAPVGSRR